MTEIKIRVLLNKGKIGVPLDKLGNISSETMKFLRLMTRDVGISSFDKGKWIAKNFENGSLAYDSVYEGVYEQEHVEKFNAGIVYTTSRLQEDIPRCDFVSSETMLQYTKIGNHIDAGEVIEFGLYKNGTRVPGEWKELTKEKAEQISKVVKTYVEYMGSIYGSIHAFNKGAKPQFISVRDAITGDLIHCEFGLEHYQDIIRALKGPNSTVYISGRIKENLVTKKIDSISLTRIKVAPVLSDEEYHMFFGCAPDIESIKDDDIYGD